MSIIPNAIKRTKEEVKISKTLSDDLWFGVVCHKYFYNEGRYDKVDFLNSYTDGSNDGGIDLIAIDENDLSKNLILIQSKNISNISSKDQIKDIFLKMSQTVEDFNNEKIGSYNTKLRKNFREKYDYASDDPSFSIELALFLGTNCSEETKELYKNHLNKVSELQDYEISIYYKNEIEQQIQSIEDGVRFVPNGEIDIYNEHGIIENNDNGILVNISALSLRKLFDRYKDQGLFEQNFRYFVKNKKIDDQISNSLVKKREKFWFLNNGIIIGCQNFWPDGNNVKLENFSIVNGCQTTTILGNYKGGNENIDFPIPCKIIKPDKSGDEYFNNFISEIAEASNSQKPISDRDLKSNQPELKQLQKDLKNSTSPILLEIKRGEGLLRKKNIEPWQKVKNDVLGQLILSVILQHPGTARSSKRKIFADKGTYNKIFKRTHDLNTIKDILKLSHLYDNFLLKKELSSDHINIAKNGKLSILAIIGFLIKHKRKLINLKFQPETSEWSNDISSDNLSGSLFNPDRPDDFEIVLDSLFNQIIVQLDNLYKSRGQSETSVTNFFKTDKKYHSILLSNIKSMFILDEYIYKGVKEKLDIVFE